MKQKHVVMGVHIQDRVKEASKVQAALTEFGCNIKTRVGMHEVDENFCASGGIVVLELVGDEAKQDALKAQLTAIEGVDVQTMVFEHE
jgi:hypothetical protein